ncbi:DUF4394 domain-containing protein [Thioalkalivibrio sp. ALJ1]|uniref:DUF4394 domain-containing protein n=1 Tax=Thioalkalivibrio sp. ALJ1 TaxID=1158144 RepID=UPI00056EE51B|nr:DUF4394 domain-containing protein [Thioalkalivibrio sp. ALJ1]
MNRYVHSTLSVTISIALGTVVIGASSSSADSGADLDATDIFAVTDANDLIRFSSEAPEDFEVLGSLNGMDVVGLDFRPDDGDLFALTAGGELVILDPESGAIKSTVSAEIADPALDGKIDMDFNPAANALRITGSTDGRNLRVGPGNLEPDANETAIEDGKFGYRQGVSGTSYSNNDPDTDDTTHYTIDDEVKTLFTQASNPGLLNEVGELFPGDDTPNKLLGYDIFQNADGVNEHWLALERDGKAALYKIDAETGAAGDPVAKLEPAQGTYIDMTVEGDADDASQREFMMLDQRDGMAPQIVVFTRGETSTSRSLDIHGLDDEDLIGMDLRRASEDPDNPNGLYAFGTDGGIFYLEEGSSSVTAKQIAELALADDVSMQGDRFSVDFNPAVDLVRILSSSGQNLRVNLQDGRELEDEARDAGFGFVDGTVRLGDTMVPDVVAVGYRPAPEELEGEVPSLDFQYVVDNQGDEASLARVVVPNDGALVDVGSLGVGALAGTSQHSIDITQGNSGIAALVRDEEKVSRLYHLDLIEGTAKEVGMIGDGTFTVTAISATLGDD